MNKKMNLEDQLEHVKHRVSEQIAENMKSYGYPATIGRVIAAIYYAGRALDLDELAEHTGMSKTRMSQVLREMTSYNIAEKEFVKGSRKDHYTVEEDYYQTFITLFTANWREVTIRNKKIEQKITEELAEIYENEQATPEIKAEVEILMEDSKASIRYFNWIEQIVELFDSQDIFKYVPKDPIDEKKKAYRFKN
ncbi:DNA-binding transcriptional regulator GbsR, MarR family [Halolactibacillus halophilus]|uniref:HTH-type transcriptional regulator n=1 Tax=Halolactibacillus halophilus TaxID=306540 RepID=A0A1I5MUX4_9BACI|nr:GbsR/MarR family transcriptional regulator [Halolactibacillus halophilus]GEM01280.1 HTH-type transcriptional repressor OpcR [Halolactibacillus halophilus]SFP13280.1 DNA-binding transcriptional regulator GbsR, MarR family [Halolactibacillus halophilus]